MTSTPFPVTSTSVETARIARAVRVLGRHPKIADLISSVGVYNCKKTTGSALYSAHAFGDAGDAMNSGEAEEREQIARAVIRDATMKTKANRGWRTQVVFVIWNDRQWVKGNGESPYTGVPHTNHVHIGCSFSTRAVPRCAGGTNYPVRYVSGVRG